MKLTLEVYSTSAGDAGGAPSFGVRIRDRRALEAGALYDPLDVNFIVDNEFLPAPETVAVSIYRPSEDALVATTAGSAFTPVPGHSVMYRGVLATATPGFDSWYEETKCPDGDHTYPVPVFSVLEVRWSCGAEDCMARAEAVPAILTPIGVRAVKGLDGTDGEDGKAPTVDVADHGDGTYRMTVTSPDGTVQTVEWRDGRDGDGANFPVPVSPADATEDDQYADALAVQGILDRIRKDLSGIEARLDVIDSLAGTELLEGIQESLASKVDRRVGYDLVSTGHISVLDDFIGTFGAFGDLAGLDKITFNELGTDLAGRFKALETTVESLPPPGDGGTLNDGYVKFLDTVVASGDGSAQRILDAVDLVLAESNDAGTGVWKAVNANAKGLADLEAKVGSGGSSPIPAELEAMIRNSVQKDAFGRGFSSNDFTQDYIDRINNSVQQEAGKGLSTVDFTMERAERLDALYNSSSTLNPPVKPDENAKEGQPADAKDTYEALKGLSFTEAPDSHGSEWQAELEGTPGGAWTFTTQPSLEWRTSAVTGDSAWYVTPFTVKLSSSGVPVPDSALEGAYLLPGTYPSEQNLFAGSFDRNLDDVVSACHITDVGTTAGELVNIDIQVRFHRELYVYKGDPYVTKTYVDDKLAGIEFPEGGGGGGTGDYDELSNKPSINGRDLSGSMTAMDLGLSMVEGDTDGEYGPTVAKHAAHSYDANHATYADSAYVLMDPDGDAVSFRDVSAALQAKRDKADNVATVDSSEFTEWEFHCSDSTVQDTLKRSGRLQFDEGAWYLSADNIDGYGLENGIIEAAHDATSLDFPHAYSSENGSVHVTATRSVNLVTKSGEPYVTPTGVKALAVPGFNQLAPETSEGSVTLKPIDGAANWVEGVVGAGSSAETFSFKHEAAVEAWNEDDDTVADFHVVLELDNTNSVIVNELDSQTTSVFLRTTKNVDLYDLNDSTKRRGYVNEGTILEFELNETVDFAGTVPFRRDFDAGYWSEEAYIWDPIPDAVSIGVPDGYSQPGFYAVSAGSIPRITLPGSTGHARSFSLALVTDAREETGLVWEGGDIIEAFPGAKNIVPSTGEIVFDVKEVAPGKMLVNRTPGAAAAGGAVTITAPNGRTVQLAVDNDLVLEVKEV